MLRDTGEGKLSPQQQELWGKLGIQDIYSDRGSRLGKNLSRFNQEASPAHTLKAALVNGVDLIGRHVTLEKEEFSQGHFIKIEEVTLTTPTTQEPISIIEITHFYPPSTRRRRWWGERTVPGHQKTIAYQRVPARGAWEPTTPEHRLSLQHANGSVIQKAQTIVINPRSPIYH